MISRRNIRVKVLQSLYANETDPGVDNVEKALILLRKYLNQTAELFTFCIYMITEVARFAEVEARKRASKHLPSSEDLSVNTKMAGNILLWKILEIPAYQEAVKNLKRSYRLDDDMVRKVYLNLADTDFYKAYIGTEGRDKKSEKELLSFIFTDLIMADEKVTDYIEEQFIQWDDDCEMIYQIVLNFLSKTGAADFNQIAGPEKTNYAVNLLKTAIEKKDYTMELIKPKLKNWDAERIAVLDLIIIRMGVCELLYFETIPTKVTINEYIDIAKSYSTNQSGQFVNGILDSIHKELLTEGMIKKVEFKKNA